MDAVKFKQYVDKSGILLDTCEYKYPALRKRGLDIGILGNVEVENSIAKIVVGVSEKFPNTNPSFFLLNQEDFISLPHVEDDGFICYTHDDTIVLDSDNPAGIISECFGLALQILANGITRNDNDDFYNEYEAYWRRLKGVGMAFTNIALYNKVGILKYTKIKEKESWFAATDETDRINSYHRIINSKDNPPQFFNGLYIPLKPGSQILIPKSDQVLTLSEVQDLVFQNITAENEKRVRNILKKTKLEDFIVISLPQPNFYHSLFAVRLKSINHLPHPLLTPDAKANIIPFTVKRLDPEYMLTRGGNGKNFLNKKVLVIGGGAVGSAICEELVKAAVINIDIIDKEILEPENCYRHNCGFRYVHKKKAEAIKDKLKSYYPHANVNAISTSIEEAIEKKKIDFKEFDAIVVATGNATINKFLMQLFKNQIPGKPVLFSWLDPFGIGGHCLICNISDKGCYQCLYSNQQLHNIASFANEQQPKSFAKNISGCGSVYVPYGALDANQTAILTVRKVIDVFSGKDNVNAIYSWKGDSELFQAEGYALAQRYFQTQGQLDENKSLFNQSNCKLCGNE